MAMAQSTVEVPKYSKKCNINQSDYNKIFKYLRTVSGAVEKMYSENYVELNNVNAMQRHAVKLFALINGKATKNVSQSRRDWLRRVANDINFVTKMLKEEVVGQQLKSKQPRRHNEAVDRVRYACVPYMWSIVSQKDDGADMIPTYTYAQLAMIENVSVPASPDDGYSSSNTSLGGAVGGIIRRISSGSSLSGSASSSYTDLEPSTRSRPQSPGILQSVAKAATDFLSTPKTSKKQATRPEGGVPPHPAPKRREVVPPPLASRYNCPPQCVNIGDSVTLLAPASAAGKTAIVEDTKPFFKDTPSGRINDWRVTAYCAENGVEYEVSIHEVNTGRRAPPKPVSQNSSSSLI